MHDGARNFGGHAGSDRPRTGAQVHHHRVSPLPRPIDRPAGEQFGLGPGHEDTRSDGELDMPEASRAGQVLQGLAPRPPVDHLGEVRCSIGIHRLDQGESASRRTESVGEEFCGVVLRRIDARGAKAHLGGAQEFAGAPHDSKASSRAVMSACTQESMSGSNAPLRTASRLNAL